MDKPLVENKSRDPAFEIQSNYNYRIKIKVRINIIITGSLSAAVQGQANYFAKPFAISNYLIDEFELLSH